MIFKGRIYDITIEDSNYIVKVLDEDEKSDHKFLASIVFTQDEFNSKFTDDKMKKGIFVISVSNITTSIPSIKVTTGNDGENDYSYTYLSDDSDQMLTIFKGKIIDFYFEKK